MSWGRSFCFRPHVSALRKNLSALDICGCGKNCYSGLSAKSIDDIRDDAKQDLVDGKIKFIFVVDLYNEGVDIPHVNTVLFLRPTESDTVFLQQLAVVACD